MSSRHALPLLLTACFGGAPEEAPPAAPEAPPACAVRSALTWPDEPGAEIRWEDCPAQGDLQRLSLTLSGAEVWAREVGAPGRFWTAPELSITDLDGDGRHELEVRGRLTFDRAEGPARLIALPSLEQAPPPLTCAHQRPLPSDSADLLWILEDHAIEGHERLRTELVVRDSDGLWEVFERWGEPPEPSSDTAAPEPAEAVTVRSSFRLDPEENRPEPLRFPATCPDPQWPATGLSGPLTESASSGVGMRRGFVLAPAPLRQVPEAGGAIVALVAPGSVVEVLEVGTRRVIPGTGEGYPDARVRLSDGAEGWIHTADMATAGERTKLLEGRRGLWLAHQDGAGWWSKLGAFEHPLSASWLVADGAPARAVQIGHRRWTGSSQLLGAHVWDIEQDGIEEILLMTEELNPEAGSMGGQLRLLSADLSERGAWPLPLPRRSGLPVRGAGQAQLTEELLLIDRVTMTDGALVRHQQRVPLFTNSRYRAEVVPLPLRGVVHAARRARSLPREDAPAEEQIRSEESVLAVGISGGPASSYRAPSWVQTPRGWLPADAIDFEEDYVDIALRGDDQELDRYPWLDLRLDEQPRSP